MKVDMQERRMCRMEASIVVCSCDTWRKKFWLKNVEKKNRFKIRKKNVVQKCRKKNCLNRHGGAPDVQDGGVYRGL